VHGSNAKILSVELSLPQISKNAVSFLLFLVFSLHKIEEKKLRIRGQNRFCLEARRGGEVGDRRKGGQEAGRRGDTNNVYIYEQM
jgi:hypothetical protein